MTYCNASILKHELNEILRGVDKCIKGFNDSDEGQQEWKQHEDDPTPPAANWTPPLQTRQLLLS